MQLYQPLRAANKPPAEPAVLIYTLKQVNSHNVCKTCSGLLFNCFNICG